MSDDIAPGPRDPRLPLLASACAIATLLVVAAALRYKPWDSAIWSRWDSGLYEDIARNGYSLFRCEDDPSRWCGNAAWFPAYPWLVGGLHLLGLPLRGTAVLVSWLFAAGTVVLLWATFLRHRTGPAVAAALFYAAFAPGQIYLYTIFPLSMLTFTTVACLWLLYRERYLSAGVVGAVAAISYPVGVVLVPVSVVWLAAQRRVQLRERLRRMAMTVGPMIAALWILLVDQRAETGHWNAFFLVQAKYAEERGSQNPFVATWDVLRDGAENLGDGVAVAVSLQTAFVTAVLVLVLVHTFRRRGSVDRADSLLLLWAVAAWAMPLSQSVSVQRGQAALLPVAVLVARLRPWLAWSIAAAAAVLAVWMESYFLDWTLK